METPRFYGRSAAIRSARHQANRAFVAMHADPFCLITYPMRRAAYYLTRPRMLVLATMVMLMAVGTGTAVAAMPLFAGSYLAQRTFDINPAPVEGGTSNVKLVRGAVEAGVQIDVLYSVNVTTTGAAVRAYSLPVRRISLIGTNTGGNGNTLKVWTASDLIRIAQVLEQAPIGGLIVPASGFGVANYTGLEAHIPLMFNQPSKINNPDMTAIPTFAYSELTLKIEWGTVVDLLTGTPVGPITFTAGGATVTQLDYADLPIPTTEAGLVVTRSLFRSIDRWADMTQGAAANLKAEIDLGTSENIARILIVSELTSTGEPTNTIIDRISIQEDNTNYVHQDLPWTTLRADNARQFGLTLPVGMAILDFADNGNAQINDIYRATQKGKVKLLIKTLAVAGTVRAAIMGIAPPLNV